MTHLIFIVAAMLALLTPYHPGHGNPGTIVAAPADAVLPSGGG